MSKTAGRRILEGGVASIASFALGSALALIQVPILLSAWGAEQFGAWMVLLSAYSVLSTLSLGHSTFVAQKIAACGAHDVPRVREIFGSALRASLLLSLLELSIGIVVVGLWIVGVVPIATGFPGQAASELPLALVLLLVNHAALVATNGVIAKLYAVHGEHAQAVWIGMGYRVACFMAVSITASAGGSILAATAAQVVFGAPFSLTSIVLFRRRFRHLSPWMRSGSLRSGVRDLASSLASTTSLLAESASSAGLMAMSANSLDGASTSSFATTRTVGNTALQAANATLAAAGPEMARLASRRRSREQNLVLRAVWLATTAPIAIAFTLTSPFLELGYRLWTAKTLVLNHNLAVLVIGSVLVRLWSAPLELALVADNAARRLAVVSVIRATTSLGLAALLLRSSPDPSTLALAVFSGEIVGAITVASLASASLRRGKTAIPWRSAVAAAGQSAVCIGGIAMGMSKAVPWELITTACFLVQVWIFRYQTRCIPRDEVDLVVANAGSFAVPTPLRGIARWMLGRLTD